MAAKAGTKRQSLPKPQVHSAHNASTATLPWPGLCSAVLCLCLGIITPPLLQGRQQQSSQSTTPPIPMPNSADAVARRDLVVQSSIHSCTDKVLDQFWHENEHAITRGLHILCFDVTGKDTLQLSIYHHARKTDEPFRQELSWPISGVSLVDSLQEEIPIESRDNFQPWAIFSLEGKRLFDPRTLEENEVVSSDVLAREGVVLLLEGGQWIWPGVRIGFERQVDLYSIMPVDSPEFDLNRTVTLETLSLSPLVLSVEGFLSHDECEYIQQMAEPSLEYSGVVLMDRDAGRPASDFRTSKTTFVHAGNDLVLVDIDYRTASLVRIPRTHQEDVQVLRYANGEFYDAHVDFFDSRSYSQDADTLHLIRHGRRNRLATVFWYLSDVARGGHTVFPRHHGARERSLKDCETGLKVQPRAGKVIIFYSMLFDGQTDPNSLHGACPVEEGIKWAANKWVWNEDMHFVAA